MGHKIREYSKSIQLTICLICSMQQLIFPMHISYTKIRGQRLGIRQHLAGRNNMNVYCTHENTIDVGDAEHMAIYCIDCDMNITDRTNQKALRALDRLSITKAMDERFEAVLRVRRQSDNHVGYEYTQAIIDDNIETDREVFDQWLEGMKF